MSAAYWIKDATIVNNGNSFEGHVLINNGRIEKVVEGTTDPLDDVAEVIEAKGKFLFPGIIDDQVHFREPGLTHKADIYTESKAAVAGGVTSWMDMPNTVPNTLTQDLLESKYERAAEVSLGNFSFYMGASNDNIDEVLKTDPATVCGVKVFMGSSTGNMLVDNKKTLEIIFAECPVLIATHCEDEHTIRSNLQAIEEEFKGREIPINVHPRIRDAEACYKSSSFAVELAEKHNSRLHILHISTERELSLFSNASLINKRITAEVCIHHLWFSDEDYQTKGSHIKWNPAVKTARDREALFNALLDNRIDVIAADHAPHTKEEKQQDYFNCPSGGPLIQHTLSAMLEFYHDRKISLEQLVEKMCHAPAECFQVEKRGYIKEGYWADLVLVDLNSPWTVSGDNILYKCGWSPFDGQMFRSKVTHTFVNGHLAYENGQFHETIKGQRLRFSR